MADITYTLRPGQQPTEKQIKEVIEASKHPITFDDDCPELTTEQLSHFKRAADTKQETAKKQSVTVQITPQALKKAKSLGKGYTSVLSLILENTLSDNELLKKYL